MKITFDPAKRARTLADRSLDFADAAEVFAGKALNIPDERHDSAYSAKVGTGFRDRNSRNLSKRSIFLRQTGFHFAGKCSV